MPDFSVAYTINGTSTTTTVTADTFHIDDNGFLVFCVNQPESSGIYRSDDRGCCVPGVGYGTACCHSDCDCL